MDCDAIVTGTDGAAILLSKFSATGPTVVYVNTLAMHIVKSTGDFDSDIVRGDEYKAAACGGTHMVLPACATRVTPARQAPLRRLPAYCLPPNADRSDD